MRCIARRTFAVRCLPVLICLLFALASSAAAQPLHLPITTPEQDKAFSEFNHHLAGWFLLAVGLLALLGRTSHRLSSLNTVWPLLFIIPGVYLAFMSDPDVWPMGAQSWVQALRDNPEAVQHKTFAALLLALGILELQRSRGKLGRPLALWSFPALAVFGAVLLFFHEHHHALGRMAPMPGMGHDEGGMTASMEKIGRQHFWFSITGFCVTAFKFISDGGLWKKPFVPFLWPAFISLLGVLLVLYTE